MGPGWNRGLTEPAFLLHIRLLMNNEGFKVEFNESMSLKRYLQRLNVPCQQTLQVEVAQVPCRDQQQPWWAPQEQMRIDEIGILSQHYPIFPTGQLNDREVWGPVSPSEVQRVQRVMAARRQPARQASGQLRIDDESHAASRISCLVWAIRAAKARAARMSSRVKSS